VRANYLASGAVDVAVDTGDGELLKALRKQWERTIARRTYITGGQGSHHQDEAFGEDWELPPDRAYSETCAGIGSIMFSWRLLLAGADPRHADVIERTLFNVVATSPAPDGRAFYYANTLHQRVPGVSADPLGTSPRASSSLRAPWFEVSCCPPNVARTLASLDSYVATADSDGIQLQQYAPATVTTTLDDGRMVSFDVDTQYPADGRVVVTHTSDASEPWTLGLRVPAWASGATLRIVTADFVQQRTVDPGMIEIRHAFRAGDVVQLDLPMAPRVSLPDGRIDAVRGCVAVERGPEVLALESVDLAPAGVDDVACVAMVTGSEPVERDGRVWIAVSRLPLDDARWPYGERPADDGAATTVEVPLVPYHEWAERGPSTMRVWIPQQG
jgi:DUF1680 family protein